MALPRILHHNILAQAASVVASSTATGMAVANLSDGRPYTWWGPSAAPASIEIDAGVATEADYLYIPSHTLDSTLWDVSLYAADLPFSGMQLLTAPEDFSNAAWGPTAITVTVNAVAAPDGTTTADKLVETAVASNHLIAKAETTTAQAYTASAYFKAGERSIGVIRLYDGAVGTGYSAFFNLAAGTVGTVEAGNTATIGPVEANGYRRCTVSRVMGASAGSQVIFGMAATDGVHSYTGDGTSGLYCWGSMFNAGSTAAPYIPVTAGRWISETALAYSNRVPTPQSPITGAGGLTVTTAAAVAPNGLKEAVSLIDSAGGGAGSISVLDYGLHASEGGQTGSVFVRKTTTAAVYSILSVVNLTGGTTEYFNVTINTFDGTITAVRGSPADYGIEDAGDYWWVWVRAGEAANTSNSRSGVHFYPAGNADGSISITGVDGGEKIIWGLGFQKQISRPAPYRTDAPIFLPFASTTKRYWLLRLNRKSGSALCAMSVCMIGKALTMPTGLPQGYDPVGRKVVGQRNRNERGQPLGTAVDYKWRRQTLRFQAVSWAWVRNVFARLWDNGLASEPAGFIWDYESHVEDVQYVTLGEEFRTPHKSGQLCDLEFDVEGVVE